MLLNLKTVASSIRNSLFRYTGHHKTNTAIVNDGKKTMRGMSMHLTVTEAALTKIEQLCLENNMEAVRPYVAGGGCAGMQHAMTFAEKKEERDTEVAPHVYVDPVAIQFLDGATIDYDDYGMSPSFVFQDVFKHQGGTGMCGGCGAATGPGYGH